MLQSLKQYFFAADIRNLDFPEDDTAEELPSEGMEIFQKIIGKLKFRYEQSLFENPIIRVKKTDFLYFTMKYNINFLF